MAWAEWFWTLTFTVATVRAITTAWRKESEGTLPPDATRAERLILREDMVHWWLAALINASLLSVGVVALLDVPWEGTYVLFVLLLLPVFLNVRIELHGHYYRKRNGISLWEQIKQAWRDVRQAIRNMLRRVFR